jgi:hypothetical protein
MEGRKANWDFYSSLFTISSNLFPNLKKTGVTRGGTSSVHSTSLSGAAEPTDSRNPGEGGTQELWNLCAPELWNVGIRGWWNVGSGGT